MEGELTMAEPITITNLNHLNALVAEKVMGLELFQRKMPGSDRFPPRFYNTGLVYAEIPDYSRDMNAAIEVARAHSLHVFFWEDCVVSAPNWRIAHQSPASAICLAALRCEGIEVVLKLEGE